MSQIVGRVAAIYRYPVRSMRGELVDESEVSELGLVGDRAYSVVEPRNNVMASACTDVRNWGALFEWQAAYLGDPQLGEAPPAVRLTSSQGVALQSDAPDFEKALCEHFGRPAHMWHGDTRGALSHGALEKLAKEGGDTPGSAEMPSVPYVAAPVHLLTTASIEAASALYPEGRFDAERFRPNVVIETSPGVTGFVEKDWVHGSLTIGTQDGDVSCMAKFDVFEEAERCVATTLPNFGLPKDAKILRTIAQHNRNQMGIYAGVPQPGRIRVGDPVLFQPPSPPSS